MKHRLRRGLAALALATAATALAVTGLAAAPQADTAWGAPDTTEDTAWGVPPVVDTGTGDGTSVKPFDTAWG